MDCKTKQMHAYEWMLELTSIPLSERHHIMRGAELLIERGWPSNHFTVGMAIRAGAGEIPPLYQGLGSEERYFQALKSIDDALDDDCVKRKKAVQSARSSCWNAMAS